MSHVIVKQVTNVKDKVKKNSSLKQSTANQKENNDSIAARVKKRKMRRQLKVSFNPEVSIKEFDILKDQDSPKKPYITIRNIGSYTCTTVLRMAPSMKSILEQKYKNWIASATSFDELLATIRQIPFINSSVQLQSFTGLEVAQQLETSKPTNLMMVRSAYGIREKYQELLLKGLIPSVESAENNTSCSGQGALKGFTMALKS